MTGDQKFSLRRGTSAELDESRREHAKAWSGGLSVDEYIGRENHLASQTLTANGGINFWVLVNECRPNNVLCSCESINKEAVVKTADGKTEVVRSHIIGSVYTPIANRGNGYATVMMNLLAEVLDKTCLFDALYSDIGKTFYAKMGWIPHRSSHLSLPPAGPDDALPADVKYIFSDEMTRLCVRDVDQAIKQVQSKPLPPNFTARVAYLPTPEVMQWHHAREEYLGTLLTGKTPTIKGAVSLDNTKWLIWTRIFNKADPKEQKLTVLRAAVENTAEDEEYELVSLLKSAQIQARDWGMKEVVIWNPNEAVVRAAHVITGTYVGLVERELDSIASIRWNGKEGRNARILWDLNEKFAWC